MPAIPPINVGALKVTFPANLPRNEKDLICMLLAGRLKDLWNGKLICAQLALNDLIKDLGGFSTGPLAQLKNALISVNSALGSFKQASGYDQILAGVNNALGQVSNVFSLGGLCPSPVQAPKIPDILGTLNLNLFGQANNILAALAQASNPKVCFGGGPKGFGIDWTQVTGSLKNLKDSINQIKSNPGGYASTITAFQRNLENQAARFNAELKRLEKNLVDPLGINEKRNSVANISRTKEISDDIKVKDRNGIEYKNASTLMTTGEIDSVLSRLDPLFNDPVRYQVVPVKDYCGDTVGFEKKIITGDPDYMGWDTVNDNLNSNTPTGIPSATIKDYDYSFIEENGIINVYNSEGNKVEIIELVRGRHFRMGFRLETRSLKFYDTATNVWYAGIRVLKEPEYGSGLEAIFLDLGGGDDFIYDRSTVEVDWPVFIENPTTPDDLIWKTDNNVQGKIRVTGITEIPDADKTYDIGMAVKKAWTFIRHIQETLPNSQTVDYETRIDTRQYYMDLDIITAAGVAYDLPDTSNTNPIAYAAANDTTGVWFNSSSYGYTVVADKETLDAAGQPIFGNWIIIYWYQLPLDPLDPAAIDPKYLVIKKYVNDSSGLQLNQLVAYITPEPGNADADFELLGTISFDEPVVFLNDIKLPYTDYVSYKLTFPHNGKLNNTEEFKVEKNTAGNLLKINLSTNREGQTIPVNEFVYSSDIQIDPSDSLRTYLDTNTNYAREVRNYIYFKGSNNFRFKATIRLGGYVEPAPT